MVNLLTVRQAAFILKVHPLTIRRYIRQKKLPAIKVAGGVRIKDEDLQNFQTVYSARETSVVHQIKKNIVQPFSFDDPLWQLNGKGASLSLPD